MPGPKPGMEARVNLFGDPGRTFHCVVQGIAWRRAAVLRASGIALILTTHGFSLMPDYAGHLIPPAVIVRPLVDEPHPVPLLIAYRPKNPTPARFLVKAIIADWRPG